MVLRFFAEIAARFAKEPARRRIKVFAKKEIMIIILDINIQKKDGMPCKTTCSVGRDADEVARYQSDRAQCCKE